MPQPVDLSRFPDLPPEVVATAEGRGCVKTPRYGMLPAIQECIYVSFH